MKITGVKIKPPVLLNLSISILAGVFAQILMKLGMNGLKHSAAMEYGKIFFIFQIFTDRFVIFGIFLYLISMFFWIKVLSKIDLSIAYPFVSIGLVFTVILAAAGLGESVSASRWFGIFITVCGVYITVSSHKEIS